MKLKLKCADILLSEAECQREYAEFVQIFFFLLGVIYIVFPFCGGFFFFWNYGALLIDAL